MNKAGWRKILEAKRILLKKIKEESEAKAADYLLGGNDPEGSIVQSEKRIVRLTNGVLTCGKMVGKNGPRGYCKNTHLCSRCYRKYREHIVSMLDKYREGTPKKRLFIYERTEDFRAYYKAVDFGHFRDCCLPVFLNRRMQLMKAFRFGMAGMVGMSNRIELVSVTDKVAAFRMTTLMAFEQETVHSMSPYWESETIYSKTKEGYLEHVANLRFVGMTKSESETRKLVKEIHPSRILMYGKLGPVLVRGFLDAIAGKTCWNTSGPALHEVRTHLGRWRKKYRGGFEE